jgi:hypothetical protein
MSGQNRRRKQKQKKKQKRGKIYRKQKQCLNKTWGVSSATEIISTDNFNASTDNVSTGRPHCEIHKTSIFTKTLTMKIERSKSHLTKISTSNIT